MLYHVEGIVIRTMDYKETDKIVTILTREHGKLSFVGRGVKRAKSRYGAACQLFSYGDFSFYLNRNLGTLRHADVLHSFYDIRADLDLAAFAAYLTELIDLTIAEGVSDERLFASYLAGLQAIEKAIEPRVIVNLFELRLLAAQGYAPQFRACVTCGVEKSNFVLSAKAGGVVCDRCMHFDSSARAINETLRRLLYTMQRTDVNQLGTIELSEQTLLSIRDLLRYFIDYHIEHKWKSRAFLDQWQSLR